MKRRVLEPAAPAIIAWVPGFFGDFLFRVVHNRKRVSTIRENEIHPRFLNRGDAEDGLVTLECAYRATAGVEAPGRPAY